MPVITLRPITPQNYEDMITIKVHEEQKSFVGSNVYSLAEAGVFPKRYPLAIYADETPVGFLMSAFIEETQRHWIFRLMIAADQQQRGYGRAAMHLLIERMRAIPGCTQIYISYKPVNNVARKLYSSLGFCINGEIEGGEEVAVLNF